MRSSAMDLVVVDSVAALVPRAELEGDMGAHHMGLQVRMCVCGCVDVWMCGVWMCGCVCVWVCVCGGV